MCVCVRCACIKSKVRPHHNFALVLNFSINERNRVDGCTATHVTLCDKMIKKNIEYNC